MNIEVPSGNKASTKNNVNTIDHQEEEDKTKCEEIFAIQSMIQCNHAGGKHCKDIQCHMLINHLENASYLKKHPKTEELVLKSNPTPQQQNNFRPLHQQHENLRYTNNRVNEIEDEQDTVDKTHEDGKSLQETQDNEDICLINANQYKEESNNEGCIQNISNFNINLQE
eukprot:15365642-Ditylum_brightwellii.AAC.2